jgi:branched-chain amino acid transport system substrate-binding protein
MSLAAPAQAAVAEVEGAYFRMINLRGGVHGKHIVLISLDDGGSPSRALEQAKRLVEEFAVDAVVGSLGAGTSEPVEDFLSSHKIPQLLLGDRFARADDPSRHPYTMGFEPGYAAEASLYTRYVMSKIPHPRLGILRDTSPAGEEYLSGVRSALGADADATIIEDAAVSSSSQLDDAIRAMAATHINALFVFTGAPAAVARQVASAFRPRPALFLARDLEPQSARAQGVPEMTGALSVRFLQDPRDPTWGGYSTPRFHFEELTPWESQQGAQAYVREFAERYVPDIDSSMSGAVYAYSVAGLTLKILEQCGADTSSSNIMTQATDLRGVELPLLIPGVRIDTSPGRLAPLTQGLLIRFDGRDWVRTDEILRGARSAQN